MAGTSNDRGADLARVRSKEKNNQNDSGAQGTGTGTLMKNGPANGGGLRSNPLASGTGYNGFGGTLPKPTV